MPGPGEFEIRVPPGQSRERLDTYLANHVENTTRSKVQQAIREGHVLVDGKPVRNSHRVSPGEVIAIVGPTGAGKTTLVDLLMRFYETGGGSILDEATSSVDPRKEMHIQNAMLALMKARTSFVIAHRLSTIRKAHVILVMDEGRLVEQGNHTQPMAAGGFYAGVQMFQSSVSCKAKVGFPE